MRRFRLLVLLLVAALPLIFVGAALAATGSPGASTGTPDLGDDLGSWAALVGIGLPAVTAVLQKATWPAWLNALIFAGAVAVASVVYGFARFGSHFTWAHWQGTLLAIVVWGIATYHLYWHPPGKRDTSLVRKIRTNVGVH